MRAQRYPQRLDCKPRNPADDLLFAFIFSGWEQLLPLQEAIEVADYLAWDNPIKARELSDCLVRGEEMPPAIQAWINSVRNNNAVPLTA